MQRAKGRGRRAWGKGQRAEGRGLIAEVRGHGAGRIVKGIFPSFNRFSPFFI